MKNDGKGDGLGVSMDGGGGEGLVKHLVLAKFKDEITPQRIEEVIKGYADLVSLVKPMKTFQWGRDVSTENLHQGFTHIFESTLESVEGVAEYLAHPAHVEFARNHLPVVEKLAAFDYIPAPAGREGKA